MTNEKENPIGDSENQENQDNDYGLPEAEFSPIDHQQPEPEPEEQPDYVPPVREEEPQQRSSNSAVWIALVVVVVLAAAILYFFLNDDFGKEEVVEKPKVEEPAPEPVVEEEEPIAEDEWNTEPVEPVEPETGTVTTLNSRTGRYYTIVGSFIDGDLARDYAQTLADKGVSATIIEPAGNRKFYRLGVADADALADLEARLPEFKAEYGDNVWIVKY